jgi:hypothetical protein
VKWEIISSVIGERMNTVVCAFDMNSLRIAVVAYTNECISI